MTGSSPSASTPRETAPASRPLPADTGRGSHVPEPGTGEPDTPRVPEGSSTPRRRHLAASPIGVVPITWNNVDLTDLAPQVPADAVLDACAGLAFEGVQLGRGFPQGDDLRQALRSRGLRLAEVYAELPVEAGGPTDDALEIGRARLDLLTAARGDVLVVACRVGGGREGWAARGDDPAAPRLTSEGWHRLARLLDTLARDAAASGRRLAFHPHAGTFVETPGEVRRLAQLTDPGQVAICLDVGHYLVGGGDPVAAIRELGRRISHVHMKDVDGTVLARLRDGELGGFADAIRARLFTELGRGLLPLDGVVGALAEFEYNGWLMVEQDSSWLAPEVSAAESLGALREALAR